MACGSFSAVAEVVEQRHTVGLRPDADLARVGEAVIGRLDDFLAIECHREFVADEIHSHGVPSSWRDFRIYALERDALAFDGVVNRHIVFERVGADDVVIVGVRRAPYDAAGLVFLSCDGLEFHLDESVLERGVVFQCDGILRFAALLEDVRLTRRGVVLLDAPFRRAVAGLRARPFPIPMRRQRPERRVVEVFRRRVRGHSKGESGEYGCGHSRKAQGYAVEDAPNRSM